MSLTYQSFAKSVAKKAAENSPKQSSFGFVEWLAIISAILPILAKLFDGGLCNPKPEPEPEPSPEEQMRRAQWMVENHPAAARVRCKQEVRRAASNEGRRMSPREVNAGADALLDEIRQGDAHDLGPVYRQALKK